MDRTFNLGRHRRKVLQTTATPNYVDFNFKAIVTTISILSRDFFRANKKAAADTVTYKRIDSDYFKGVFSLTPDPRLQFKRSHNVSRDVPHPDRDIIGCYYKEPVTVERTRQIIGRIMAQSSRTDEHR